MCQSVTTRNVIRWCVRCVMTAGAPRVAQAARYMVAVRRGVKSEEGRQSRCGRRRDIRHARQARVYRVPTTCTSSPPVSHVIFSRERAGAE